MAGELTHAPSSDIACASGDRLQERAKERPQTRPQLQAQALEAYALQIGIVRAWKAVLAQGLDFAAIGVSGDRPIARAAGCNSLIFRSRTSALTPARVKARSRVLGEVYMERG